jgi:RNA-directed DNA polymerase
VCYINLCYVDKSAICLHNIPKPGKDEQRALGIPTMYERGRQCLVKLALEPEWEARFENNSYGFRPGRSCHDAIEAIFNDICQKARYVFDADIRGCFDNINQAALLKKLQTYPHMRQAIKAWLKAGVMTEGEFTPTESGTPQGGLCKALHNEPYAKWKAMQSKRKKSLKLLHVCPTYFA